MYLNLPESYAALHYWHSKDPLNGWYPHIHILMPNVVWNKRLNEFQLFDPFLDKKVEVPFFRRRWTELVVKRFGEVGVAKSLLFTIITVMLMLVI